MNLKPKLIIQFLAIALIPMLFIGFLFFFNAKTALIEASLSGVNAVAESKEAGVFLYLDALKTRTLDFASDGFVRDSLKNASTSNLTALNQHLLSNKIPLSDDIIAIDVLNLQGQIVSSTQPERIGLDKSAKTYFIAGQKQVYIADIHQEPSGLLEIEVSAPITDKTDAKKLLGVIVNHYNARLINQLISGDKVIELGALTQIKGIGETGEAYLVNQNKVMVTDSKFIPNSAFKQRVNTYPVNQCLNNNQESNDQWLDYQGRSVVGSSMCLSLGDFKWVLISEQNTAEAFAKITSIARLSLIIGSIALVIVSVVALFTANSISNPIIRLTKMANSVSKGKLNAKLDPKAIKVKNELGDLTRAFDRMRASVRILMEE